MRGQSGEPRVYFAIFGREVKIGLALDPAQRVAEMRTAKPDIKLLGSARGKDR
jgi:hypothetical protein